MIDALALTLDAYIDVGLPMTSQAHGPVGFLAFFFSF